MPPRYCDDCGEEIEKNKKRRTCKACKQLVCEWCYWHIHKLAQECGAGE